MQAAATCFVQPLMALKSAKSSSPSASFLPVKQSTYPTHVVARVAAVPNDTSTVDYSSTFSVFPAEACETIGGEACAADMYPEAVLPKETTSPSMRSNPEPVERDYFDYESEQKSVLKGEACDDLGGEFCEAPYKSGVY